MTADSSPCPGGPRLIELLRERILIIDGAMGTLIQSLHLTEQDFRGNRFREHKLDLRGCNDVLVLTQPDHIANIHRSYLEAGADIIETDTFNANALSMSDYGLQDLVYELNVAGATLAAAEAAKMTREHPDRPRFVAGAIGPTNRTASISADVNDPRKRSASFDELRAAYFDQAKGLIDGGVDLLLAETVFDTLNLKAALFAIADAKAATGRDVPVMASVTISDLSGRTLAGQTMEAFWNSIRHADLFAVGINCSLGPQAMRPYLEELSALAPIYVSCVPNAGLPNLLGEYDETAEQMAQVQSSFAGQGWLNLVGGCCGTSPAFITAIRQVLQTAKLD